jgi:hypothetical protein
MTVTKSDEYLHRLVARAQLVVTRKQTSDFRPDFSKVLLNDCAQSIPVLLRVQLLSGYPVQRSTGAVNFTDEVREGRRHDAR